MTVSGGGVSGWHTRLAVLRRIGSLHTVPGLIIRFAFNFTLELVFFLALFCKLLLALFIGIIGSCHSFAFVSNQALL